MYHKPCRFLALLFLFPLPILCDVCNYNTLPVTSVSVQNVTFNTATSTNVRRGLNMSIGTPPQFLAWGLSPQTNNSFVFSDTHWATGVTLISEDEFGVGVGGLYIENSSSTWVEKADMSSAGASTESALVYSSTTNANDTWGTDILHLNASYDIPDLPIDIVSLGNVIGLGANSTVLNALFNAGIIASRTWSVFWGLAGFGASAQMNGITVFGGYDKAKTTGENMTVPLTTDTACSSNLVVTVTSLDLQFPDGETINLESGPIKYCINPGFNLLSLHPDTLDNFINASGGTFLGTSGSIYEEDNAKLYLKTQVFDGTLNFTFDTGLSVVIPNNQLVVPDYTIQNNGTVTFNESERVVLVSQGSRDAITELGQPLLSAMVLMVTHDTTPPALTIWASNNDASNDFAAIDSDGNICTSSGFAGSVVQDPTDPDSSTTAAATSSPSAATSSDVSSTSSKSKGFPAGAIAGIAVGGLALILIISGAIFFFRRTRHGGSPQAIGSHSSVATELQPRWSGGEGDGFEYVGVHPLKAELPGTREPQELPSADTLTAELAGNKEFPGELHAESYQRISSTDVRYELN